MSHPGAGFGDRNTATYLLHVTEIRDKQLTLMQILPFFYILVKRLEKVHLPIVKMFLKLYLLPPYNVIFKKMRSVLVT